MPCRAVPLVQLAGGQLQAGLARQSSLHLASDHSPQQSAHGTLLSHPSAQGKLYLYESSTPGAKLVANEAVWAAERRVVRVPPENVGGAEHVVALCPGKCTARCCVRTVRRLVRGRQLGGCGEAQQVAAA